MKITYLCFVFCLALIAGVSESKARESCFVLDRDTAEDLIQLSKNLHQLDLLNLNQQKPTNPKSKAQEQLKKDIEKASTMITEIDLINESQVMMCVQSADVDQNSSGWDVKGDVNLKLAKFIDLIGFSSSYNSSNSSTKNYYTCRNTKTGEMFYGTMDEVIDWYNDFLESNQ